MNLGIQTETWRVSAKKTHTEGSNLRKNNSLGHVFGFWFIMAVGEFVYFNLSCQ